MRWFFAAKKEEARPYRWGESLFLAAEHPLRSAEGLRKALEELLGEGSQARSFAEELLGASRGAPGGLWWAPWGGEGVLLAGWRSLLVGRERGIAPHTVYRLRFLQGEEAQGFAPPRPAGTASHAVGLPPFLEDWTAPKEVLRALLPPADPLLPPPEEGGYEKAQELYEVREALTFLLGRETAPSVRRLHALPQGVVLALAPARPVASLPFPVGEYRVVAALREGRAFTPGIEGPLYREEPFSGALEALVEEVPYRLAEEPGEEYHRIRAQRRLLRFLERYPLGGV